MLHIWPKPSMCKNCNFHEKKSDTIRKISDFSQWFVFLLPHPVYIAVRLYAFIVRAFFVFSVMCRNKVKLWRKETNGRVGLILDLFLLSYYATRPTIGGIKECWHQSVCLSVCCVTFAESEPYCHSILFVCLDVCRSFRDLQPTMIDRSQPNLVGRYIPVLGPM